MNGASGAENSFTVDGVVTNSLVNGKSRQDTVFEYLQEVQVKTGGANAEFGGALGGVISAVTKSGGNVFHGEGHYYFSGSPIERGADSAAGVEPDRRQDRDLCSGRQAEQTSVTSSADRSAARSSRTSCSSSGRYRRASSAEHQQLRVFERHRTGLDQPEPDAWPVLRQGQLHQQPRAGQRQRPDDADAHHRHPVRLQRRDGERHLQLAGQQRCRRPTAAGSRIRTTSPATSTSGWPAPPISACAAATSTTTSATPAFRPRPAVPTTPRPSAFAGVPASLQLPLGTQNTPRSLITNFDTTKRGFVQIDYNHTFTAAGTHQLKGGYRLSAHPQRRGLGYPGGYVLLNWGRTFTSLVDRRRRHRHLRILRGRRPRHQGQAGSNINSLFVQDAWTPTPRLTLNLGVRSEHEVVPSFREGINAFEFGFGQKIAPRLGATFDVRGDGKIKVYGSWGKYFDWTKYDLPRGSYGGDIWQDLLPLARYAGHRQPESEQHAGSGSVGSGRPRTPSAIGACPTSTRPTRTSSRCTRPAPTSASSSRSNPTSVVGVHYVHNYLGRTIEDMGGLVNGNEVYVIGNPGEGIGAITPSGRAARGPFATPKPIRQYDALELTYSRRFSNNWFASASYTLSRLYGNYAGSGQFRRDHDADHRHQLGDDATAGRKHRPPGRQRRPRLGPRRGAGRFAR